MYDFLNIIGSRNQAEESRKTTDYKPTKNDKVVRFLVTPQVKQTPQGDLRKGVVRCHFCRLIIGAF